MLETAMKGWAKDTIGELDHRLVKPPYVRLSSCSKGEKGDVVTVYDLRVTQPNQAYLETIVLHSVEHILLAGFRKYMPKQFICVAPMGCQTGFYLILLNAPDANSVCDVYEKILQYTLTADSVPYASEDSCGQAVHHDIGQSQDLAGKLLAARSEWLDIL